VHAWPGSAYPLGADFDGDGTNFALYSAAATAVDVCLFDEHGAEHRVALTDVDGYVWHAYLPGVAAGTRYGYRVTGDYAPERGVRCNPAKLLIDPYAKAIEGQVCWGQPDFGYDFADPSRRNDDDSALDAMKAVVVDPAFDWAGDRPPATPYDRTVVYEAHVRGLTMRHPAVPASLRGTFAAVGHPAVVDHLRTLGVTAIELMPVHQFVQDQALLARGLTQYWGYNTIGYFAPHNTYAAPGRQVREFKAMVRTLHAAGIEVILDVVYNHTAEGNHLGPTLSLRGIDNAAYYRLEADRRYYTDDTGTGNTLNAATPSTLQLIMDSLRYWVQEMHVDGFRFDLAAALARGLYDVDRLSAFFDIVQQDPVISQVKLIAEPWDVGPGGYQVGNFPPQWSEWNGRYRDTVRDFWRGQPQALGEFASRLTGSSDLYEHTGRRPAASVNFVTAHDGFTLRDLVSYERKHNEANGEDGRDGTDDNRSTNGGVEGPTSEPGVLALRARRRRAFMATLLLSQGVPMLLHGDEVGRTQQGNNNAYPQDNETTWIDWADADTAMLDFTSRVVRLRHEHPVFRRRRFFDGRPVRRAAGAPVPDIVWLRPDGTQMQPEDWDSGFGRALGVFLNGDGIRERDRRGRAVVDSCFLLLFNAGEAPIDFVVPDAEFADGWRLCLDTADDHAPSARIAAGAAVTVADWSLVVLIEADAATA